MAILSWKGGQGPGPGHQHSTGADVCGSDGVLVSQKRKEQVGAVTVREGHEEGIKKEGTELLGK